MLHGNLQQRDRETVLANFKAGKTHTLISTDVAARGIHIKRLKYVRVPRRALTVFCIRFFFSLSCLVLPISVLCRW